MRVEDIDMEAMEKQFQDLRKEAKTDAEINKLDLKGAFDNTSKVMKWIDRKQTWKKLAAIIDREMRKKHRDLFEFYKKDFQLKLDSRDEFKLFITSDPQYFLIEEKLILVQTIIKFLNATIDAMKARAWEVKGFIEYQKFIHGD